MPARMKIYGPASKKWFSREEKLKPMSLLSSVFQVLIINWELSDATPLFISAENGDAKVC